MALEAHRFDQRHAKPPVAPSNMSGREAENSSASATPGTRRQAEAQALDTKNRIIHQRACLNGNCACQDRLTVCQRYKDLGFCTHDYYKNYMYSNCPQTCMKCKCISWAQVPLGDPTPVASCSQCCSDDSQCPRSGTWGRESCTLAPPQPWKPMNGYEVNYLYDRVGGPEWEITAHPYWRVEHRKVLMDHPHITGEQVNESPVPRRGVQMVTAMGKMYMFGGLGMVPVDRPQDYPNSEVQAFEENAGEDFVTYQTLEYLNDMWTYNYVTMMWTRHWAKSTRPTHRAFHSMVVLDDTIVVYGGFGPACYEYCKDVWMFNITRNEWESDRYERSHTDEKIHGDNYRAYSEDAQSGQFMYNEGYRTENEIPITDNKGVVTGYVNLGCTEQFPWCIPTRRFQHAAVAYQQPAFKEYGFVDTNSTCYNMSIILGYRMELDPSTSEQVNKTIYFNYSCTQSLWTQRVVPSRRVMIIHGGFGGARKGNYVVAAKLTVYMDDTWKYDLDTLKWEMMNPWAANGIGPGKRRGHSAVLFKGSMYIFGGRITDSSKTAPQVLPRVIHKSCGTNAQWTDLDGVRQPWEGERVINDDLFCIDDYDLVKNDVWQYNIMNNSWHEIVPAETSPIPLGRHGHKLVIWDDIIYTFGGYYDPIQYLDDTWHFNITARQWHEKYIAGAKPSPRSDYGLAIDDRMIVLFSGYGRRCEMINDPATTSSDDSQHLEDGWEGVISSGKYCSPVGGTSYYNDHTWQHSLAVCPNDCTKNGRCHYGSCICDYLHHGLDCSNFTCPDCLSMADDLPKQCPEDNPGCDQAMACEIYDAMDVPVTLSSENAVDQRLWTPNTTLPIHDPPFVKYDLSDFTTFDNCHYEFSIQQKVCRSCSEESHGTCDYTTGFCMCDNKFSNFDCSYEACPHPTCNGGGTCLLSGKCMCYYNFFGEACAISFDCPAQCSFNGICEVNGTCVCYEGFVGSDCSSQISVSGAARYHPTMLFFVVMLFMKLTCDHFTQ